MGSSCNDDQQALSYYNTVSVSYCAHALQLKVPTDYVYLIGMIMSGKTLTALALFDMVEKMPR